MLHGEELLEDISTPEKKQASIENDSKPVRPMLFSEMAETDRGTADSIEQGSNSDTIGEDMLDAGHDSRRLDLGRPGPAGGHGLDGASNSEMTKSGAEQAHNRQSAVETGEDSPFSFPEGSFGGDSAGGNSGAGDSEIVNSGAGDSGRDDTGGEDGAFNMPGMSGWVAAKITDKIEPRMRRN
jgi:hypothetical protein